MKVLRDRIMQDGRCLEGGILKVDRFINHQMDPYLMKQIAIGVGACIMILGGVFPAVGAILTTIPQAVLGGCTIMMFGSIVFAGFRMMSRCGFTDRNMIIVALSLSIGLGFTQATGMFSIFPQIVQTVFAENCVAVVFLLAVILNLILPGKDGSENPQEITTTTKSE